MIQIDIQSNLLKIGLKESFLDPIMLSTASNLNFSYHFSNDAYPKTNGKSQIYQKFFIKFVIMNFCPFFKELKFDQSENLSNQPLLKIFLMISTRPVLFL